MNPTCNDMEERIDLRAAGWLSEEDDALLDAHLAECPACRELDATTRGLAGMIASQPAPAAPPIVLPGQRTPSRRWIHWVGPAIAACVALAVVFRSAPVDPAVADVTTLSEQSPSWATYRLATTLSDEDLVRLLDAHDRAIDLYEPPVTSLAQRMQLEGLLL